MRLFSGRNRDSFEDTSLWGRYVKQPLQRLGARVGQVFERDGDPIGKQSFVQNVIGLFAVAGNYLILAPVVFLISGWASTRRAIPFFLGLPAVLVALASVSPSLAFNYVFKNQFRNMYDRLAARAIVADNADLAVTYSRKVLALTPGNKDYYVRLASALGEQKEDKEYALALIEQVTDAADENTINANLWVVQHLISRNPELSPDDFARAEQHLRAALGAMPAHFSGNRLGYELYMRAERPSDALPYIRVVAKADPLTSHLWLQLLKELGKDNEFESTLTDILLTIGERASRIPNAPVLWQELVTCALLGERFQDAIDFIEQGRRLASDPAVQAHLDLLESTVLVKVHDKIIDLNDKTNLQQGIMALNRALAVKPANGDAILRASNLYLNPNFDSKRMDWVVESLAFDPNSFCSHVMFGWRALFIDKEHGAQTAAVHWKIANTITQRTTFVLAQLAIGIADLEPDKLPFAIQVVELAMTVAPTMNELGLARAHLLSKQERWFEAKQQLEDILPLVSDRITVLTKLIECCQKLGEDEQAADYGLQLEQLTKPYSANAQ